MFRTGAILASALVALALVPSATVAKQPTPVGATVIHSTKNDTSAPLASLADKDHGKVKDKKEREQRGFPGIAGGAPDTAIQSSATGPAAPATASSFEGIGQGLPGYFVQYAPPDTNGSVGPNHFVQTVNASFAVFSRTGTVLYGPVAINTLFTGFGGLCEADNDGDPSVVYDQLADRWIITQFAVSGANGTSVPYQECIAISTSGDPTGTYSRYAFARSLFPDYPKLGVWPDAYYMSTNDFNTNGTFAGASMWAFDRAKLLIGVPATAQVVHLSSLYGSLLPSSLDGQTPPPAGAPNYFVSLGTSSSLFLWRFHVDFANVANSAVTGPISITVAGFTVLCSGGACVPQAGTTQTLDALADRLMYRLAYRNFGDHESLVVTHSVAAGAGGGVRWYEIRNPGGSPLIYQQSTYAPDGRYRWMGSAAMDRVGDIGVGYSLSSSTINPAIAYTGRAVTDPLNTLQPEAILIQGTGSQLPSLDRWGDYSSMSVDPSDDCTFWYTTEYLTTNGDFNWHTRVGTFKFDGCSSTPTPVVFASDQFTRTVANNWGTATTGGAWSLIPAGNAADFDVTGTAGTITLTAASANRSAVLAGISAQDVDLGFRVATNKPAAGGSQYLYGIARRTSATNSYRLKLRIATNGAVYVQASSVINNAETTIGNEVQVPGLSHAANTFIRLRGQLEGINPTTIRMRAWADGSAEPATWQYTVTNSVAALQAPGAVGLMAYAASATSNAPVVVTFDDLLATSIGAPVTNTAPVVDTATISPSGPTTGQTLTASYTAHDAEGDALTPAYQWTRNGTDIGGATGSTLNLATAGNGDKGDLIRVRVTVSDASLTSAPLTSAPVTVANSAPIATVGLSPASPDTNATLTATATRADPDGDTVSLTYVWKVNGTTRRTTSNSSSLSDTFDLSTAGNGDPGDVVSVEVTPNDGTVSGSLVSAQVTVAGAATVYASDTFSRTVVNTWGSAPTGGAYTLSGTAADFAVTGATGTMRLASPAANQAAILAGVSIADVDLSFRVATDKAAVGGNQFLYGIARRVNASTEYRAKLRLAATGAVYIQASSVVNNVETTIGGEVLVVGLSRAPGAFIRLRAQFLGTGTTTIRMRAWADGSTEPSAWQYIATNSTAALQAPGGVGLRAYLASATTNAPVLVSFDDLLATSIGP